MTEQELREKIKLVLKLIPIHIVKQEVHPYDYYIDQIQAVYKEAGYVKLADICQHARIGPTSVPNTVWQPQELFPEGKLEKAE